MIVRRKKPASSTEYDDLILPITATISDLLKVLAESESDSDADHSEKIVEYFHGDKILDVKSSAFKIVVDETFDSKTFDGKIKFSQNNPPSSLKTDNIFIEIHNAEDEEARLIELPVIEIVCKEIFD
jgi:hypothetical protein